MTAYADGRRSQFVFDPGSAHRGRGRLQLECFLIKFPRPLGIGHGNGNESDFLDHDCFNLWMMILLPSGSWTMAIWHTGDSKASQANFTSAFFNSAIASSKSSTSNAAPAPWSDGVQVSLMLAMQSVSLPIPYSIHFPSTKRMVSFNPSAPS